MQTFCTIVTPDFIPFAKVLYYSLKRFDTDVQLQVLVIGKTNEQSENNINIHPIDFLKNYSLATALAKKYAFTSKDKFRWALKPVFISYLIEEKEFEKVVYVDPDICFFEDFHFLFTELATAPVLLSPHWRDTNPFKNEDNFIALYKDGLYNGGFIGASTKGIEAMKWWAELCHYKMDRQIELGIYDDQRYLDAMPLKFQQTTILQHRGCNVAKWNINECRRENKGDKILINGEFPIVFIHFTNETIVEIEKGEDKILTPFLDEYKVALKKENINLSSFIAANNKNVLHLLKEKTLLRTRIKRFFYRLAEKL